jgi:hypothetical protein
MFLKKVLTRCLFPSVTAAAAIGIAELTDPILAVLT